MATEWIVTGKVRLIIKDYCDCEYCQGHDKSKTLPSVNLTITERDIDRARNEFPYDELSIDKLVKVAANLMLLSQEALTNEEPELKDFEDDFRWTNYHAQERQISEDVELRRLGMPDLFGLIEEPVDG